MRAKEFVINVPITITFPSDGGNPTVNSSNRESETDTELDQEGVFVPPLQQKIELMKAGLGKESGVINRLLAGDDDGPFED